MKFLVESVEDCTTEEVLNESTGTKSYYITGPFAESECVNRNKRKYPKTVMESALNDFQKKVDDRSALGELNHPQHPQVNPDRAAILVESINFKDNVAVGRAKVLNADDFPQARIVRGLIREGIRFGVSTRALGKVALNESGIAIVQPGLKFNAIDVVSDPSGPNCFVNGLMENAEWIFDEKSGNYIIAEEIQKEVKQMRTVSEHNAIKLFESYLRKISKKANN